MSRATPGAPQDPQARQLEAMARLLHLEQQARHAPDPAALAFVMVNDSAELFHYRQATLWRLGGPPRLVAASGVTRTAADAPLNLWQRELVAWLQQGGESPPRIIADGEQLPAPLRPGWHSWSPGHALWRPLPPPHPGAPPAAGLLLLRETPWQEAEAALLGRLADAYGHAWAALGGHTRPLRTHRRRLARVALLLALLLPLFIPVRLSVLAPARITPLDPQVVTAPLSGVIADFQVTPNQPVDAGQPLFRLEDTELRNHHQVARQSLAVAEAEYRRAEQQAFADPHSKAELGWLAARRAEQAAEVAWLEERLSHTVARARQPGIALFADPHDWLGRPVAVGEKVLTIADPQRVRVTLWLPVADAIPLEPGAEGALFLNTTPDAPLPFTLDHQEYQPAPAPDGVLAFRLRGALEPGVPAPRIGLGGTAKMYGQRVTLYYYVFRKPLAALRQWLGL